MLLLPLLVGVLLVLNGPQRLILGSIASKETADDVKLFDKLIDKIFHPSQKYQKYIKEQGNKDFKDYTHNSNNLEEKLNVKDVNFAAADDVSVDKLLGAVRVNIDSSQISVADPSGTEKVDTTREQNHPPMPPQLLVQEDANSKMVVMRENDFIFAAVLSACSVTLFAGLIMAGVCWYKLSKKVKAASDVDYPAYGVTGPTKERLASPGDRKLAQSAQMYHYQHQKQQMIALEKANSDIKPDASEEDSDEENDEGDYTVYECPGLAPTGEMEVHNPLFFTGDAQTPVNGQTLQDKSHNQQK